MKNLTTTQKVLIVIGVLAIIFVILNWNKIFGNTGVNGTQGGATSRALSVGDNVAVNKLKRDLSNLGIQSERDVLSKENQIKQAVENANKSFRNIGSNARAEYTSPSSRAKTKCSDVALNRDCTGYAGILFGTVCITWGCAAK